MVSGQAWITCVSTKIMSPSRNRPPCCCSAPAGPGLSACAEKRAKDNPFSNNPVYRRRHLRDAAFFYGWITIVEYRHTVSTQGAERQQNSDTAGAVSQDFLYSLVQPLRGGTNQPALRASVALMPGGRVRDIYVERKSTHLRHFFYSFRF